MLWKLAYGAMILCLAATAAFCLIGPNGLHADSVVPGEVYLMDHHGSIDGRMVVIETPEVAMPVASGDKMVGWMLPDYKVADPFSHWPVAKSSKSNQSKASRPTVKGTRKVSPKKPAEYKPKAPVLSSMHKDLDRVFGVDPAKKRPGWQKDRLEYERRKQNRQSRDWDGTFPGRS